MVTGSYRLRDQQEMQKVAMAKSAATTDVAKPFSLTDKVSFWLLLGGAVIALGGIAISIAASEYHPPWASAWFITGVVLCGLGFLSVLWAAALYFARKLAEMQGPPDSQVTGIGVDATTGGQPEHGAHLWSVLHEIRADLRRVAEAIGRAQTEDSYATVGHEFDVTERWDANLREISGMDNKALYVSVCNADWHIRRIRRDISGSAARPRAVRPQPAHDLDKALEAIREAETALTEELGS
jgi:hypothetical protein